MKKKMNVKTMIRRIVREEVAMVIKEVLNEIKQPKQKQNYTKNTVLNEVLNEIDTSEWKTMGETKYTSNRMSELMGGTYKDLVNDDSENSNGSLAVEMGVNPDDPVAAFLKKDYKAVMKAIDKKQGK